MDRIEITRAQFEEHYNLKPEPSSIGMLFCTPTGIPLVEFVFIDDEPLFVGKDVEELERMYRL